MLQKGAIVNEQGAVTSASQHQSANEQRVSLVARIKDFRNLIGARLNRLGLQHRDFSILSNDCWSGELYDDWEIPCRTPFRGLGMTPDSFLRFLGDIERYIREPIRFIPQSKIDAANRFRKRNGWLIALLAEELEIYFVHYTGEEQARHAWEEGCRLINLNRIAVKFTVDKDGALPGHAEEFSRLPFERKLLLSKRAYPDIPCAVRASRFDTNGALMFRRSLRDFDCAHWLNTGEIRRHTLRVFLNKVLYFRGV